MGPSSKASHTPAARLPQEYSTTDAGDFLIRLPDPLEAPANLYLGLPGDTGLSACFGLRDIGRPVPGDTVLVSAAAGAVGSVAGQIARIMGARAVGITSGEVKAERLCAELGYNAAVDRHSDLDEQLWKAWRGFSPAPERTNTRRHPANW